MQRDAMMREQANPCATPGSCALTSITLLSSFPQPPASSLLKTPSFLSKLCFLSIQQGLDRAGLVRLSLAF